MWKKVVVWLIGLLWPQLSRALRDIAVKVLAEFGIDTLKDRVKRREALQRIERLARERGVEVSEHLARVALEWAIEQTDSGMADK